MTTAASTGFFAVAPLTPALLRSLLTARGEPCVSVYLPTRRATPPDDLNRIVLRGLVADATRAVASWLGPSVQEPVAVDRLLAPLIDLMASPLLQAPAHDGLTAFMADGTLELVAVDGPVEPETVVAPRFHLLPLVRRLAATEHCLVIAITERLVRVGVGEIAEPGNDRFIPLPLPRGDHAAAGELFRDEIVEIVLAHGGAIVPLDRIQMPTETGVAAIYRYATS